MLNDRIVWNKCTASSNKSSKNKMQQTFFFLNPEVVDLFSGRTLTKGRKSWIFQTWLARVLIHEVLPLWEMWSRLCRRHQLTILCTTTGAEIASEAVKISKDTPGMHGCTHKKCLHRFKWIEDALLNTVSYKSTSTDRVPRIFLIEITSSPCWCRHGPGVNKGGTVGDWT